ncbi:MAG: molecular chaperone TorD family protein [Vicinamibacterales bacterium]
MASSSEVTEWLARASLLQFASLALQPPSAHLIGEMRALVPSLPEETAAQASTLLAMPLEEWEPEFFSVLGPAGCPSSESSYERAAQASRGPLLARVAAFYDAFGYAPERLREVPDHIANELGFLSFIAMKVAFAMFESKRDEATVAADAYETFRSRHLSVWLADFVETLAGTGSPHFGAVAALVRDVVRLTDRTSA